MSQIPVNRAHISEFIHFEDEAQGIETSASDLPDYQWSMIPPDLRAGELRTTWSSQVKEVHELQTTTQRIPKDSAEALRQQTCYIPSKIYGSEEFKSRIRAVCKKHIRCFNTRLGADSALVRPMTLEVDEAKWCVNSNKGPPRAQTLEKQAEVEKQVLEMLKNGIISTSTAEYDSQVHLTPKPVAGLNPLENKPSPDNFAEHLPDYATTSSKSNISTKAKNGWRFCIDFRNLNACSKGIGGHIPNIRHLMQRLGSKKPKRMGKLDLTSGYHQAPLAKESRHWTAFITHLGVFEWNRVVMGQKGAGTWFQSMLATVVLLGLMYLMCELYIDDLIIFADSEDQFIEHLDTVLGRLVLHKVTVNPDKCVLGVQEVEFVGHVINEKGLSHTREKLDKILQIPPPTLGKDLKSFLGVAIWVCDHIRNYSTIVR